MDQQKEKEAVVLVHVFLCTSTSAYHLTNIKKYVIILKKRTIFFTFFTISAQKLDILIKILYNIYRMGRYIYKKPPPGRINLTILKNFYIIYIENKKKEYIYVRF